jgi:hypothetical protein
MNLPFWSLGVIEIRGYILRDVCNARSREKPGGRFMAGTMTVGYG